MNFGGVGCKFYTQLQKKKTADVLGIYMEKQLKSKAFSFFTKLFPRTFFYYFFLGQSRPIGR